MNLLHDPNPSDLEDDLRATLRRRSTGLVLNPPAWEDLIERTNAVVIPLTRRAAGGGGREGPGRVMPRPVFIAAAITAVVLAGGMAVHRTGSEPSGVAPAPASFSAPAPTDASFDATSAPAVWASGLDDPVAAATAYLAEAGIAPDPGAPALPATPGLLATPTLTLLEHDGTVAAVEWSAVDGSTTWGGTVFLRAAADQAGAGWTVVASATDAVALEDVSYDGRHLSFTVARTADGAGPLAVSAWSGGEYVEVTGDAVADAADLAGAASAAGQLIDIAEGTGARETLTVALEETGAAVLRVHQLAEGRLVSVTEMAVQLPGADASTDVAGTDDADADVEADAGTDAATNAPVDGPLSSARDTASPLLDESPVSLPDESDVTAPSVPDTLLPGAPPLPTTIPTLPPPPDVPLP